MKVNIGFFFTKLFRKLYRPALRDCNIDPSALVGSGSNCIRTHMGRYSYMGNNCVTVNTTIGSFCSIASYCCIGGGNHPLNLPSTSPIFYEGRNGFGKNFSRIQFDAERPVVIGNDVWIGEKVFVKDGINIGNGAIVGSHSVVTHDVPPYAIVAGCPARIIKYRFDTETIMKLQEIRWWDWSDAEIADNSDALTSVEKLLEKMGK